jgi:lysophospholipase L1-like esterase
MKRFAFALTLAFGCGSSMQPANMNPGGGGGGGVGGGGGGGSGGGSLAGATIGTYIVLGDSISDSGGTGPYFNDLLHQDLVTKFPNLMYVHGAQQGAITDTYSDLSGSPTLASQIAALGSSYPGDVLVTITIGGNDLNGHAGQAIGGTDDAVKMEYSAHLAAELGTLTTPGRLGTGAVHIVLANIYDFTDGQGDFRTVMCGPPINVSAGRVATVFTAWNALSASAIATANGTLYDLHGDFAGHGFNAANPDDVWYDRNSCLHPNAKGHAHIAQSLWSMISP